MKFPRNTKLLRSPFDMAPFAAVFFLLLIFLLLGTLLPVPGLSLQLPAADELPGANGPTVAVAIDSNNRLFFSNQLVTEDELKNQLRRAAQSSRTPLTLVVQADKSVSYGELVRVTLLARNAGIRAALLATLPRAVAPPDQP
jgi:biopolymer transport protein ExbD